MRYHVSCKSPISRFPRNLVYLVDDVGFDIEATDPGEALFLASIRVFGILSKAGKRGAALYQKSFGHSFVSDGIRPVQDWLFVNCNVKSVNDCN